MPNNQNRILSPSRYTTLSIILHWLMAVGFLFMLGSGLTMEYIELEKAFKFQLYQWHKSSGVLLLLSLILRIAVRLVFLVPSLPVMIPNRERRLAHMGHMALYAVVLLMVTSGWLMVSSSVYGLPTIVFGWFEWPHISFVKGDKLIRELSGSAHFYGALLFIALLLIHILAVIKHKMDHNINLLKRMWW